MLATTLPPTSYRRQSDGAGMDDSPLPTLSTEDEGRVGLYRLISCLMLGPDRAMLTHLMQESSIESLAGESPLTVVLRRLSETARERGITQVEAEFTQLFVAVGTPAINPHESFYRTGFLMEKPLVALRQELATLGFARVGTSSELEDHLAALCETMALLIASGAPLDRQYQFFDAHLVPWYEQCVADIAALPNAPFYTALSDLIALFLHRSAGV